MTYETSLNRMNCAYCTLSRTCIDNKNSELCNNMENVWNMWTLICLDCIGAICFAEATVSDFRLKTIYYSCLPDILEPEPIGITSFWMGLNFTVNNIFSSSIGSSACISITSKYILWLDPVYLMTWRESPKWTAFTRTVRNKAVNHEPSAKDRHFIRMFFIYYLELPFLEWNQV